MNKSELISSMAQKSAMTKKDSESALNVLMASVEETLGKGERVQLIGFGTFETRKRQARKGINPKTGQEINIPASNVPVFKASKVLKNRLNG